jgi:hypothetical protein
MTEDERALLLEIAKYCYATGMCQTISAIPLALAIKRFEPDFELPPPEYMAWKKEQPTDNPIEKQSGILSFLGWKN